MSALTTNFTTVRHRESYATISPSRPELSQKGRVVLITGSSTGIGFAIARSFAQAHAAMVILTGRQESALNEAIMILSKEYPETSYVSRNLDVSQTEKVEDLWKQFHAEGIVVDVLVLNAAHLQPAGSMLDIGYKAVSAGFALNVVANAALIDLFYHQKKRDLKTKLSLVNVSTSAIHDFRTADAIPNYSASKSAGTLVATLVARGVSPDDLQVLSFHPGAIFTGAAQKAGYTRTTLDWDDENLPGDYAVWAASEEAKFLHGRFTWAAWDVNELSTGTIREKIDANPDYLKVGVVGL